MSIEDWLERKPAPAYKSRDLCDNYGFTLLVVECTNCGVVLEGLFKTYDDMDEVVCPRCRVPAMKVNQVVRKIWLQ